MKSILIVILFSILSAIFLFAFLFYAETNSLENFTDYLLKPIFIIFICNALCIGLGLHLLNNRAYKLLIKKNTKSISFLILFITDFIIAVVFSFSFLILYFNFFENSNVVDFIDINQPILLNFIVILLAYLIIYSVIGFFFFSYRKYSALQVEMVSLKQKQLALQLEALEQQLSPHFLFNNLNTISSLIYADINNAETYIRKFAIVYSKFSSTNTNQLTTLKEELAFVDEYIFLLNTRFENSLNININVAPQCSDFYILPLSLQLLIENAIKHNAFDEESPLRIEISSDKKQIYVKNNINASKQKIKSHKIGHSNLIFRYKHYTNKKPVFKKTNGFYIASLPLIQKKNNE